MSFVRVALDVPLRTLFDYRAADAVSDDVGRRALIPFGRKIVVGVIMELANTTDLPLTRIRSVLRIMRDVPPLPADVLSLLRFCSDYYHHPLGEVVMAALPTRLRRRHALKLPAVRRYRLTEHGLGIDPMALPGRATVQREILGRLRVSALGVDEQILRGLAPGIAPALKSMSAMGWIEAVVEAPDSSRAIPGLIPGPVLSAEQQQAVDSIRRESDRYLPWLLHGITGSGKTEIYLALIASLLARDRQILLLVPEINLTPQLEALLRARFPDTRLVALHSGLSERERLNNWLLAQNGTAGIVLGTRLAVFTPLPRLGMIIVDEEHDASFKQMEGLRYSARDIALVRAKTRKVPVILGSATPSLEIYHLAHGDRCRMATLTQRVNAVLPAIVCVATRGEKLIDGLSQTMLKALHENVGRKELSLVFINRRGYAPVLYCAACAWTASCQRCTAKLVLHLNDTRLRCHHCGFQEKIPAACPRCGNADLAPLGQGTQRVETALTRIFPDARILRIDRDSTRRKNAWNQMRDRIRDRDVDILVGTQMLSKGHDFPQLTLVGVINADSSLYSSDFRASERLFGGLTQVAGRAGRADLAGKVLIQTEFPAHPLYQSLCRHDYRGFAQTLLKEREQAALPPFAYLALLRAEAPKLETALAFLKRAADRGHSLAKHVTLYDPVPAIMPRLAGQERAQLMVQSRSRSALQVFLAAWLGILENHADRRVRWSLDVDPLDL
jgi:primosomal protein N' (replication factor Y) (superfamily II helicase)